MIIVIQTQFCENYGAHDWDGNGICPQYWKHKDGSTYFVKCTIEDAQDKDYWSRVETAIEHKDDYSHEYIIYSKLVDDIDFNSLDYHEPWKAPFYIEEVTPNNFYFKSTTNNKKGEYQYMRDDILEKQVSYFKSNGGGIENYNCVYYMVDGNKKTHAELMRME